MIENCIRPAPDCFRCPLPWPFLQPTSRALCLAGRGAQGGQGWGAFPGEGSPVWGTLRAGLTPGRTGGDPSGFPPGEVLGVSTQSLHSNGEQSEGPVSRVQGGSGQAPSSSVQPWTEQEQSTLGLILAQSLLAARGTWGPGGPPPGSLCGHPGGVSQDCICPLFSSSRCCPHGAWCPTAWHSAGGCPGFFPGCTTTCGAGAA